ncbi:D-serine deaminase-like pyridoxal phosphate-dependent protein [Saccharothrix tamanrassetensis]|uniref:D-serine deaminase-like pyridoxal phosphate-dependent protein n=1 Tax=Saccharothrix tamanrassetensis TaxID=1051531 RepID=A0A841CI32_9PSEU|nr:amino acid deaminase [Saccharothrix tamanrassetensis]MBB5956024.1 D-serine deaminase-like pyridoxal phosphate-dependent protein [Saccharothrix tamanrassetensis]
MDIDRDAVAAIRREHVDWRFKGLPASTFGTSLGEVADRRLDLFADGFVGPLVVLDAAALEHNLATMSAWCAARGVLLAPHGKTTMAPQLFARQFDHGAWAITAANVSQLRVYRAFGVRRVLLANQLVDPAGLAWLAAELAADPSFEFTCWVDSVAGVRRMTEALGSPERPVDVLVELGAPGGRTGARDLATAVEVAEAAAQSPALRLAGVGGYEGALAHDASAPALSAVDGYLGVLRELVFRIRDLFEVDEPIVTGGGSAYFDQVAAALTAPWPFPVRPVLRSGAYITHDDGFYRGISPLGRGAGEQPFRSALRAWAQVTSKPEPELALLTMGKRDASFDEGLPEPQVVRGRDGVERPATGVVTALNDQHTFLRLPADSTVEVGDWVGFGLSHPCTVFDKWQLLPVVDGTTVVDLVRTYF